MSSTFGPGKSYAETMLGGLAEVALMAAEAGARQVLRKRGPRRTKARSRQPGPDSPMWNVLRTQLRNALKDYGAKARLARYLGVPRQRLTDYTTGNRRIPDGETTLRILHWLHEQSAGRDPSALMPDATPASTRQRLRRE